MKPLTPSKILCLLSMAVTVLPGVAGAIDCASLASLRVDDANLNHGLRRSYAAATMDGSHWGTTVTDGRWAMNDRIAETDWAWRAVTETARVAKALLLAHYGRPQERAYFAGCSTGGRMGASLWSRPACAYPAVATLRRGGDANRPEDFYCRNPAS